MGCVGWPGKGGPGKAQVLIIISILHIWIQVRKVAEGGMTPIQNERKAACDFWDRRAKPVDIGGWSASDSPNDAILI